MKQTIDLAQPNFAYLELSQFEVPVVTMNIDSLHKKAGTGKLVEINGNLEHVFCPVCHKDYPFGTVQESIYCRLLYGDLLKRLEEALELIRGCDELLVIGTSFSTSSDVCAKRRK